ncbi:hypothetical protein EMPS_04566 [Entomortierella parvispora]|uniref:DAGKc domain-containing protein n=1 Tax=Entomortierella parvispora TaxID=205924 RepID=A0A9P3H8Q3_9FUNG|nr:hypothetical protein EMPS_04566 [Entomortierella parvispora]
MQQPPSSIQTAQPVIVVLNPNAGKKQGKAQLISVVEPALKNAAVPYSVIETTGRDHARVYFRDNIRQFLRNANQLPGKPDGVLSTDAPLRIMVLGGDGTVHEIVNGVLNGLEEEPVLDLPNPRITLSVIPLGSGNAIATSLGHATVLDALGGFLRSNNEDIIPMKIMSVSTRKESSQEGVDSWKVQTHTLVVNSFGLHCSTVYDGEGLRLLGNERFKVSVLKNIAFLKQYTARIDFHGPVQKYDANIQALTPFVAQLQHQDTDQDNNRADGVTLSLSGPFTYLMITKQAFLEPGFSPTPLARTSDDWLDVLAVQNVGRGKILEVLSAATKEGYKHIGYDKVEYYKAKAVEIETPVEGRLCIDGEFIHVSPGPKGRVRIGLAEDSSQLFSIYGSVHLPNDQSQ